VLLVIGFSKTIGVDIILSSMGLGITLINLAPRRSLKAFDLIKGFSPPIYILFFVFVGAKLQIGGLSVLVISLVLAYVVARSIGKIAGCYLGAVWSKSRETVKKHLGLCLFAQGGVAIGLSIAASARFDSKISDLIVLVVTATTLIVQLAGPLFIKMGVAKAGEIGLNVTEEDLIKIYKVRDMISKDVPVIFAGMSLAEVIDHVGRTENSYYPVVGNDRKFIGIITLDGIRKIFRTQELHSWLVAMDIAQPITICAVPQMPLAEAMEKMQNLYMQYLPVVQSKENGIFEGILDYQAIQRNLTAEILLRQQKADNMPVTAAT
jgi:CBS domain-containing protein